jgi:hypothetical protein
MVHGINAIAALSASHSRIRWIWIKRRDRTIDYYHQFMTGGHPYRPYARHRA